MYFLFHSIPWYIVYFWSVLGVFNGCDKTSLSAITFYGNSRLIKGMMKVIDKLPRYFFFIVLLVPFAVQGQTTTLADNGTQVTAASVLRGTTNNILVKLSLTASSGTPNLSMLQFSSTGTYAAADVANLKLWYSTDAVLDGGDAVIKTIASPTTAGLQTFNSFTQALSTSTRYFFITVDINAGATLGNTMGANSIGTGNFTVSAGSKAGST